MKAVFFEWQDYEQSVAEEFAIDFANTDFVTETFSLAKAQGYEVVSIFVDSRITNAELDQLAQAGTQKFLLRCAGFNMLDVDYAKKLGMQVVRVASYSPESIAEFVFALILPLARKLNVQRRLHAIGSSVRTVESMGFTLYGKTLGLHGYGKIGRKTADIARGFGMRVIFFDPYITTPQLDQQVASLEVLYAESDIVSIHMPLNAETKGCVNAKLLANVKPNFMLINTARGPIVDSDDLLPLIESSKVDYLGTDVWRDTDEFDRALLRDDVWQANHVAFFTKEAVKSILEQTKQSYSGQVAAENAL
jgi:D-lactate dehydrogenase